MATSDLHGLRAEDVVAIQAVLMKYGFLLDDRAFDRLGEVFTEDATLDFRDHRVDPPTGEGPFAGLAEIKQQMHILQHPVQHMMVSHLIDSVSGDEVHMRTKALIPLKFAVIADIAYRDVVVRTPAGWRIKSKSTYSHQPLPSSAE